MQVSFNKNTNTEASITINIEEADYKDRLENKIKDYTKKAQIQGFRPGKVPASVIQKMYGQSLLVDEVNHFLSHSLTKYLQDNKIHALGHPIPDQAKVNAIDWNNQKDFEFTYTIGMAGEFAVVLSPDMKVTHHQITAIGSEKLEDFVEQLRKAHGGTEEVDTSTEEDILSGELSYPAQDATENIQFAIQTLESKFRKQFVGLSTTAVLTFDAQELTSGEKQLPNISKKMNEAMAANGGEATFTISSIQRPQPAPLDTSLFQKVLGPNSPQSLDEFKVELEKRLLKDKQDEADWMVKRDILNSLTQKTAIELPDELLIQSLQEENPNVPVEELRNHYTSNYAKEIQWGLITDKICEEHQLTVTHEETVNAAADILKNMAASQGLPQLTDEKEIKKRAQEFLTKDNGKSYKQLSERLLADKIFSLIQEKITVTQQQTTFEDFEEISKQYAAA